MCFSGYVMGIGVGREWGGVDGEELVEVVGE